MSLKNRSKDFSNYENRESFPQVAPQTNDELGSLRFKKLDQRATLPTRGSSQSAGLDLYSIEEVAIAPRERALVRTGLAVAIPEAHYGRIAPRSGLALRTRSEEHTSELQSPY